LDAALASPAQLAFIVSLRTSSSKRRLLLTKGCSTGKLESCTRELRWSLAKSWLLLLLRRQARCLLLLLRRERRSLLLLRRETRLLLLRRERRSLLLLGRQTRLSRG
jgi:hypothetical protein